MNEVIQTDFYQKLREGSIEAFMSLSQMYKTSIFQFFYRLLANARAAEESTQLVFLRAFRMRRLIRVGTDLAGLLFRIACDVSRTGDVTETLKQPTCDATLIEQAVSALPLANRSALLLHRFAKLSDSQIASALKMSERAIRPLLKASYKALQQQLSAVR